MRHSLKYLIVMILALAGSRAALASGIKGSISFGGSARATATGITFTNPDHVSVSGVGDLSGFASSQPAFFNPIFNFAAISSPLGESLFAVTNSSNNELLTFVVTSYTVSMAGGVPVYRFSGTLALFAIDAHGGYTATLALQQATFVYGGLAGGQFTGSVITTPEPSGLILLGPGLVSTAGMVFRRRRAGLHTA